MFITSRGTRGATGRERSPVVLGRLSAAAVTVMSALAVATHLDSPFGHAASLAFVVLTPAFAICGLLPGMDGVVVTIVGAAGSVGINALVAQTMLAVNAWSPFTGVVAVGVITAVLWLLPAAEKNRPATKKE